MALEQKGFEVIEAENGAKGIEAARMSLPDLILCDVNMEKVDGYSTLSSLRSEVATASVPFILMTGLADHAGMRHGMELGADDYLPKPFSIEALYAAVEARLKKVQTVRQEAEKRLADLRDNIGLMLPHELRTPLNGILGYGEILRSEAGTLAAHEVAEMGQGIYESGKRLERLIENFLIYAQIELLGSDPQKLGVLRQKRTEHPAKLVEREVRNQAQQTGREHDLVLNLEDGAISISEEYLAKIINEVTHNAFKFSENGSPVSVCMSEAGAYLSLVIADKGRGFSTEHITRVGAYMQFDRKLNEQQGIGLGLTIAKRLTELHGGTLTIDSKRDSRTVITIKLPRSAS